MVEIGSLDSLEIIVLHACRTADRDVVCTYGIPAYEQAVDALVLGGRFVFEKTAKPGKARFARRVSPDDLRPVQSAA